MCECAGFGFFATGLQYDAPVITALKDTMRTLREKISVVFVCERRDVMVDALTYFLLSSLVVTVLLLPEKHTETKSAKFICDYKTFSRFVCRRVCSAEETYLYFFLFHLLDGSPVFKNVDVSQHVDNKRACEAERERF